MRAFSLAIVMFLALASMLGAVPAAEKVAICHIPPGNPSNAHTIMVGASAVAAHLAHGDSLGECADAAAAPEIVPPGLLPDETLEPDFVPPDRGGDGGTFSSYHSGLQTTCGGDPFPNYVILELGNHMNAGSDVTSIQFRIATNFNVNLRGTVGNTNYFVPGASLQYNLNNASCSDGSGLDCFKKIHPDGWDRLRLRTSSGDGLQIARFAVVKSNRTLVDVDVDDWLDRYYQKVLDFSVDSAVKKWSQLDDTRVTDLYYAGQDLGQTGAAKYMGVDNAWCSEFASYMIRKNGLHTPLPPSENIGTKDMSDWFANKGRRYTRADVESGAYTVLPGDYIALWADSDSPTGTHSVLFRKWSGAPPGPGACRGTGQEPQFRTIEGNTCQSVRTRTRDWCDVAFIGNAQ